MKSSILCPTIVAVVACLLINNSRAAQPVIAVDWETTASGKLGSIDVTLAVASTDFVGIEGWDMSGPPYSAAPLSSVQPVVVFVAKDDWALELDQPVPELLVHLLSWRGRITATGPDPPVDYVFSQPFTILSGLEAAIVDGNTLTLSEVEFHSGVLRIAGPISTLTIDSLNGPNSYHGVTFAMFVPEPATFVLLAGATGAIGMMWGRSRSC